MKRLILFFLLIFSFFFYNHFVFSRERYATCDLCGYCPPNPPPSNWQKCAQCLYPQVTQAESKQTLLINPQTNLPPTPYPGRQYTMLGCIRTNLNSFQQEGAAASVVQILLNIVFSTVGGIAILFIIYGSFIIMTSQDSPERINYGKRLIYGAIVGLIFALSSVFLIRFLSTGVLKIPDFGK